MKEAPKSMGPEAIEKMVDKNEKLDTLSGRSGGVSENEEAHVGLTRQEDTIKVGNATEDLKEDKHETATEKGGKMEALKSKIMGFFGQAPEQLSAKYSKLGEKRMEENPALIKAYENYLVTEGAKVAQAYKEALGKWKYIGRDKEGKFVDKTLYSSGTGDVPGDKQRNN